MYFQDNIPNPVLRIVVRANVNIKPVSYTHLGSLYGRDGEDRLPG